MIYIFLWFFLLIFYEDIKKGLGSLILDVIHTILLPAAGIYYLFKLWKKTKNTSTERKTKTL